jgi:hypothetical protein
MRSDVMVVKVIWVVSEIVDGWVVRQGGEMGEQGARFMAHLGAELPLGMEALVLPSEGKCFGLVIVDEVNGFCTVGAGNLVSFQNIAMGYIFHFIFRFGHDLIKDSSVGFRRHQQNKWMRSLKWFSVQIN